MSWRALGRQWKAQLVNRDKRYWPGSESHPQGQLFVGGGGQMPIMSAQSKEAARRKMAGEANPSHNWNPSMLEYHRPLRPGEKRWTQREMP